MSLLKGTFGGQSDSVLKTLRTVISSSTTGKFPIQEIFDAFKSDLDKNYVFDDEVINAFLEEEYGSATTGLVLNLLYQEVVLEHSKAIVEDHMHPKTQFKNKNKFAALGLSETQAAFFRDKKNYNSVLNLQLLDEIKNKSKGDDSLSEWANANHKKNEDLYLDETTSLDIKEFEEFIKVRKKNLTTKMMYILSVN